MNEIKVKPNRAVLTGAILLLWIVFCQPLPAAETAYPQQPIVIHTLFETNASNAWPAGEKAIIRELRRSGYDVKTQPGSSVRTHIDDLRFNESTSVVQIVRRPHESQASIDIWFFQTINSKVFHTVIDGLETASQESAVVAALKFNDVYRAKLEKVHAISENKKKNPRASTTDEAPPQNNKQERPSSRSPVRLGVGTFASTYFTGAPLRVGPIVELAWAPNPRLLLSAQLGIGIWGKSIAYGTQRDALQHFYLSLHLDYVFRVNQTIRPFVGFLVGGSRFQTRGTPSAELSPTDARTHSFNMGIRSGFIFTLTRSLSFVATFSAVALLPNIELYFGTDSVANYGPIYGTLSLSIRVHF